MRGRSAAGRRWILALIAAAVLLCRPAGVAAGPPDFATTAPIAYMVDLGSGRVLFARDERRRFLPASLTKIMTAYVAFELIAAGKLHTGQTFPVSDEASRKWAGVGSTMFLERGNRVSVDALLMGLMTVSANDAAVVLAEGASGSVDRFVAEMNAQARRLGLGDSRFATPNGWPDEGATYTTAADLATLTRAMIVRHPTLYRRYVGRRAMTWNGIRQASRNPLLGEVPGADGVKTGFTNESGYGLVGSAVRDGRRLVMVVAGYRSARARKVESRGFLEWGFAAWEGRRLFSAGETAAVARIQLGEARTVPLVVPTDYFLTVGRGEPLSYRLRVRYRGPLRAPVRGGAEVAELVVAAAGQGEHRLPLVAARDVRPAGFWARLRNGLLGLVGL